MGIVGRNILLLSVTIAEPLARQKEKLDDHDIRRQRFRVKCLGVFQVGVATEQPVDHRADKPSFKVRRWSRLFQRQGGEDREMDRAVADRTPIQGVNDMVGLAEAQRKAHDQPRTDVADNVICDGFRVREDSWHRTSFILCAGPSAAGLKQ